MFDINKDPVGCKVDLADWVKMILTWSSLVWLNKMMLMTWFSLASCGWQEICFDWVFGLEVGWIVLRVYSLNNFKGTWALVEKVWVWFLIIRRTYSQVLKGRVCSLYLFTAATIFQLNETSTMLIWVFAFSGMILGFDDMTVICWRLVYSSKLREKGEFL